ncbi:MAG: heavy metal translocating P-type ATPase [Alphaproteobacteria bacterium]
MAYYRFPIKGLDCASCALKVETALKSISDVTEVVVNLSAEKVYVTTNKDIPFAQFKEKITPLGYHIFDEEEVVSETSVWDSPYFKSMLISGLLILLATIASFIFPDYGKWAFLAAALVALFPVLKQAIQSAQNKNFLGMNILVSLAVIGAVALGEYMEAALVVFLYNVGEVLEHVAASKARKGISRLAQLAPDISYKVTKDGVQAVASDNIEIDDVIELRPGKRLAVDGEATTIGEVDESAITGESLPQQKNIGDDIAAGSIGIGSPMQVKATSTTSQSSLSRIQNLVEEANSHKSPIARRMDKFANRYTPIVVIIAFLTAIVPPLAFGLGWQEWIYAGIGLLLIACPCALVISTPTVIASTLSVAAKEGILVKSGATIEGLADIKNMAFDKTGTLTKGQLSITDIYSFGDDSKDGILDIAIQVEQSNNHPLAEAIRNYAGENIAFKPVENVVAISGKGVTAYYNGDNVAVYSAKAAQEIDSDFSDDPNIIGSKVVVVKNNKAIGMIVLQDELRAESGHALKSLKELGIAPIMLTGDNKATAQKIAAELDITVVYELLPAEKLTKIAALKTQAPTAMVGDGINDTPALSEADIGIAMGAGTDVALEVADAALSSNNINNLPFLIHLAKIAKSKITQNIIFAVGIKVIVGIISYIIALGLLNNYPLITNNYLLLAIFSDTGATVIVTLNAMRILRIKNKYN